MGLAHPDPFSSPLLQAHDNAMVSFSCRELTTKGGRAIVRDNVISSALAIGGTVAAISAKIIGVQGYRR